MEVLQNHALHDMLGVKDGDHAYRCEQGQAAEHAGGVTYAARHDRAAGVVQRCRVVNEVSRNESKPDVQVHFLESWERGQDKLQPCRWVTDRRVSQRHVDRLMRGGRARGKIAHETCNTLNNQGDHVEHNDGHGEPHLAVVVAMLMMLAFLVDQTQLLCGALFQAVGAKLGRQRLLWARLRALCDDYAFGSMRPLFEARWYGVTKSSPLVTRDSSSSSSSASTPVCHRTRGSPSMGEAPPP